ERHFPGVGDDGFLQRQGEEQRQTAVVEVEPVFLRIGEGEAVAVAAEEGEVVVLLERLHIDPGERLQLLARQRAVAVLVEPLYGEGGEGFVEAPDLTHGGNALRAVEHHLRSRLNKDMRMRGGWHG